MNELANLISIVLYNYETLCLLVTLLFSFSSPWFCESIIRDKYMPDVFEVISNISPFKFMYRMIIISIFGFDRCSQNQMSINLYLNDLMDDEDKFWESSIYIWIQIFTLKALSLIALIMKNNPFLWTYLYNYFQSKTNRNQTNEIQLQTFSKTIENCFVNGVDCEERQESVSTSICIETKEGIAEEMSEENTEKRLLSIAWIDITLKVNRVFSSEEKLILRSIRGFVEFGSLTALMGPSGAGKTSLLKILNGMNRHLLSKDSKIYLSSSHKIRTCFIAQDQREHIISGLTVQQTLTYASKLKNTGIPKVNHNMNANDLMSELAINDIKDINIEKCSSGQQKRVVMAMELMSEKKPNLICVDEPTSMVDSYSALLVSFTEI